MNGTIITIERMYGSYTSIYVCKVLDADRGFMELENEHYARKDKAEEWAKQKSAIYNAPVRRKSGNMLYNYIFQ